MSTPVRRLQLFPIWDIVTDVSPQGDFIIHPGDSA